MPWKSGDIVSIREEFVIFALSKEMGISELCRRYGISRDTGYRWIKRYREKGRSGLSDRSHRVKQHPRKTKDSIEEQIVNLRCHVPEWGARKIRKLLLRQGINAPSERTVTQVLRRHHLIEKKKSSHAEKWKRFESPAPNGMWQMDFKGKIKTLEGWSYPLTILDDSSRFSVGLKALPSEKREGVQRELESVFSRYGLPDVILADNGAPWGRGGDQVPTKLSRWLMKIGVQVIHSRPRHPQTLGKDERFHRTLNEELLRHYQWRSHTHLQDKLDDWRERYNHIRPHESLDLDTPSQRYRPSLRTYTGRIIEPSYDHMAVRSVHQTGKVTFRGKSWRIGKSLRKEIVGIRKTKIDGLFDVYFYHHKVAQINLDNKDS